MRPPRTRSRSLSPEADEFIAQVIDTIHQLEMLMVFRRSSDRALAVDEIASELGMSSKTVAAGITGLLNHGVVVAEGSAQYRYQPRAVALHAGVESLVAAYEEDPVAVLKAVMNKPPQVLRTFSDAFIVRRRRD